MSKAETMGEEPLGGPPDTLALTPNQLSSARQLLSLSRSWSKPPFLQSHRLFRGKYVFHKKDFHNFHEIYKTVCFCFSKFGGKFHIFSLWLSWVENL